MTSFHLWLLAIGVWVRFTSAANYKEHLVLQPLPHSALLAAFTFQSNTSIAEYERQDYNLFPRSLGQILLHTHTEELHLRFALGRWDTASWGARPRGGRNEGGTGVELWAWVRADEMEEAETRWFTLTNALSGLFCASLNFVDRTKTIKPVSSFERQGSKKGDSLHLLHGALPHEVVCTENLTPFLKLLPCKGKAGISSLLDGHKLFDASWQTMAIDVRKSCSQSGECQIEIEQTVDMVLDIERSMRPAKDPIPRPPPIERIACNTSKGYNADDTCFPEDQTEERAWGLKEIFGRPIRGSCPLGLNSDQSNGEIELFVPAARNVIARALGKGVTPTETSDATRVYKVPADGDFELDVSAYSAGQDFTINPPLLYADRTFTGYGQERGGVHTVLTNTSPSQLTIIYLESLPWFMKPYLHTLRTSVIPQSSNGSLITNMLYRPAQDRKRGTHIELTLAIPAYSTVTLSYSFDKAILRYTEYPPDANRGFDVAPAVIRILPNPQNSSQQSTYVRTTSLLLPLPTPDFSMPYNVIILTSTVIAMGFGSIFNLLTRRLVSAEEVEGMEVGGLKGKIRALVNKVVTRVKGRLERQQKGQIGEPSGGGRQATMKSSSAANSEPNGDASSPGMQAGDIGNGSVRRRKA